MAKTFTLGKEERIKSRKLIDQLFSEGKKFTITPFRIHYLFIDKADGTNAKLQFAAGVSAKIFKRAVDRNRIRRIVKESWRLQKNPLQEMIGEKKQLAIFILYTAKEIESYKLVSEKIKKVIDKLSLIVTETN